MNINLTPAHRSKPLNRWDILSAVWSGVAPALYVNKEKREAHYFETCKYIDRQHETSGSDGCTSVHYNLTSKGQRVVDFLGEEILELFASSHWKMNRREKMYINSRLPNP